MTERSEAIDTNDIGGLCQELRLSADFNTKHPNWIAADLIEQQAEEIGALSRLVTAQDEALSKLEEEHPDKAEIIELRKAVKIYSENGKSYRERIAELEDKVKLQKAYIKRLQIESLEDKK